VGGSGFVHRRAAIAAGGEEPAFALATCHRTAGESAVRWQKEWPNGGWIDLRSGTRAARCGLSKVPGQKGAWRRDGPTCPPRTPGGSGRPGPAEQASSSGSGQPGNGFRTRFDGLGLCRYSQPILRTLLSHPNLTGKGAGALAANRFELAGRGRPAGKKIRQVLAKVFSLVIMKGVVGSSLPTHKALTGPCPACMRASFLRCPSCGLCWRGSMRQAR